MEDPLVRYVSTADGVNIAYWTLGEGTPFVILPALPHSHIWMEWEQHEWRRGYELAAAAAKVVRYDGRGTGLSQRDVHDFSLEALLADLDAVVGELGAGKVFLHGAVNSCPVAIAYAARHPERVSHLVLWVPVVDGSVHRSNPMLEAARRIVMTDWTTFSETVAHGLLGWGEAEAARRYAELVRAGIDQETILPMVEQLHAINVWDLLPDIQCPTLLLHRPALPMLPSGMAEAIAARIPNSQLALFEGSSSAPFIGDWRAISRAVGAFLGLAWSEQASASGGRALRLLTMKTESLSPREREIVGLVVRGLTNREIAEALYLAEKTVENHIGRILVKLDLRSRTQLAAYAVEHGLAATAG